MAISTRLAASGYVAPNNAGIASTLVAIAAIPAAPTSAQIWSNTDRTLTASLDSTAEQVARQVRTELAAELLRITDLAKVHGIVIGTNLVVTPTSRTAGSVVQTIAEAGSTVTVSRT